VLAVGAAAAGVPVLRASQRPVAGLPGVRDVDLRRGSAELMDLLHAHDGPLLLVADEVDGWRDTDTSLLERFLVAAGTGQQLALGCRLDRALRSLRGPVAEVAALRTGILLGADASDGAVLGTVLPRRRSPALPGRGHLVVDGVAQVLQVAQMGTSSGRGGLDLLGGSGGEPGPPAS
jgi:S-DNA-T family DNA segregation ATPase FtsK/SpoIIIE